jgi:type II secretion system protein I
MRRTQRRDRDRDRGRAGLTLLEVLVAMAIFLVALAGISQLVQLGADRAVETHYHAEALQKAQSKLNDVIAGSEPLSAQTDVPFETDRTGEWRFTIEPTQDDSTSKVWRVKVTCYRPFKDGKVTVTLEQMVLDPAVRLGTPDNANGTNTTTTTGN